MAATLSVKHLCLGKEWPPAAPGSAKNSPARLGQADLIGLLTARWNPRLHVQKMTCTCHVTCTCTCNMHMHMHMHAHDMHICRQG